MRIITPFLFLLLASPLFAAEPKVHRDLSYAEPKNERQTLDVYALAEGKDHPVVLWIHGGGWTKGWTRASFASTFAGLRCPKIELGRLVE